ncbi:hypothetical protein WICPIJ_006751 [Wickerhamomyces pijperi]|uniref:MPN domain-containing protein n=1 Tax=Wickerhamomyces pijperi TaxID=599730 RepID=A0A9P8Q1S6_WICPI|nr:hypothetical protein WICPIJ_006751 [Wickerhamomyces pijperi]
MVNVHPLVFLNLTDHYVRATNATTQPLLKMGVLMGSTTPSSGSSDSDEEISIVNSFDIVFTEEQLIDWVYLEKRIQQQAIILPNEIILGVYQINDSEPLQLSEELIEFREGLSSQYGDANLTALVFNPKLLQTDNNDIRGTKTNPQFYKIYQSSSSSSTDEAESKTSTQIKTKDSEKVAIDTILTLQEDKSSDEEKHFALFYKVNKSFLAELESRIDIILRNVPTTYQTLQHKDYQLLRDVNSLVAKLQQYKQGQDQVLSLIGLENNLKFYMEVIMSLQNLQSLEDMKVQLSMVPQ